VDVNDQQPPAGAPAADETPIPPEAIDAYAAALTSLWSGLAEASGQLAASVTGTWWNALPVTRPDGLDMPGSAAVLAARMARLGPAGDPTEAVTMGLIAYAQHAQAQVEDIERTRQELHAEEEQERHAGDQQPG